MMTDNCKYLNASIHACKIITLERHHHENGNLTVVEDHNEVPFKIKRVYYLYDIPGGEERGGHAHKALYQLIVAISGSFTVNITDGRESKSITLNRPYEALLIVPGLLPASIMMRATTSEIITNSFCSHQKSKTKNKINK